MRPEPPTTVARMKASRMMVTEMSNSRAKPAQTPAIRRPRRERRQERLSAPPSSRLPQYRHLMASTRISSAQKGQRLVATSDMDLLRKTHGGLAGRDQRHRPAGRGQQQRQQGAEADHQIAA